MIMILKCVNSLIKHNYRYFNKRVMDELNSLTSLKYPFSQSHGKEGKEGKDKSKSLD